MRYLPPHRWSEITPGTVIMDHNGAARRVLDIGPNGYSGWLGVLLEGRPLTSVRDYHFIAVVELDESDAIVNLLQAGFTVTPTADAIRERR